MSGVRRPLHFNISLREGFLSVFLAWCIAVLLGALPFFVEARFTFADAIFESASGLSTTGASVVESEMRLRGGGVLNNGLEGLSKSLLFWRSLLNWIGGIGFVSFVMMIFPILGGGKPLYDAEVPGIKNTGDQLTPRIRDTTMILMFFYIGLTAVACGTYWLFGMDWFDAVCHALATIATGGFSTHSNSFAYFENSKLEWAATFFMLASACNFMLAIRLFMKRENPFKDSEFRAFVRTAVACSLLFASMIVIHFSKLNMLGVREVDVDFETALRTAAFQVASIMSTTGFATSDYVGWNLKGVSMIILLLMVFGGCAGSTAGGFKFVRLELMVKQCICELRRRIFPHMVPDIRLGGKSLKMPVVAQAMAFMVVYTVTILASTLILSFMQIDLETALSASVSAISNVGPGLGKISPACTWGFFPPAAKLLLSFVMIAGRLELFTVFVVLLPRFWYAR
ncbi:MAG: TrkH family potassium uptake protein [Victivallaceae bacterium]|nr:TrkH family potassium uptake protein [Victivallaceae bacterium]